MKTKLILQILVLVLLVPTVFSFGNISTTSLIPVTKNLCGSFDNYVTVIANANNLENNTLNDLVATLYFEGSPGLSFITPQSINLGNQNALSTFNAQWTIQCDTPIQGIYNAYVNYTTTNNYYGSSIDEHISSLTVYDSESFTANFSIVQGNEETEEFPIIADNTPTLQVRTNRNAICKGSLDNDEPYITMDFIFYGTEKYHNFTFINTVSEGEHTAYVKCEDTIGNVMTESLLINFKIDTKKPVITIVSPENRVVGEFTELIIETNEKSECRFEDNSDDDFIRMDKFDTVTGNRYTQNLNDLNEETYTYYIGCKDKIDNIAYSEIEFEVVVPPKIIIFYDDTPPLTEGTFKITVIPNKKLREVPTLYYTFTDDDEFKRDINLVKEGDDYYGYIIIDAQKLPRSGIFTFQGFDLQGNQGNEITAGAAFLVDTIKPNAPQDLVIKALGEGISLNWYYSGEKPEKFNVYRSTTTGVSYIHLYDQTIKQVYTDTDVSSNQLYYYRIATVDIAGNVGPLSKEVSIYGKSNNNVVETNEPEVNSNPPTQDTRKWKEQMDKDIETLLIV